MDTNMTDGANERLAQDLDYAINLARQGETAPLLGGPIGLMWTSLATVALTLHGLAMVDVLPIPAPWIGAIWLAYGVVGTLLSVVLGRTYATKPGVRTFANRVGEATWVMSGIMIATVSIAAVVGHVALGLPFLVFAFIVPAAFALSAVSNGVLARVTGFGYLRFATLGAAVMTAVTVLMADNPAMFLVAAAGLLVSGVIPSFVELRRERSDG